MSGTISGRSLEVLGNDILHQICCVIYESHSSKRAIYGDKSGHPLASLSRASKALREISAPWLFRQVSVKDQGWKGKIWERSILNLKILNGSHAWILKFIREFDFAAYIAEENEEEPPPPELTLLLATTLEKLTKLQMLSLSLPNRHVNAFDKTFQDQRLNLAGIETLNLKSYCEYIVYYCPNVKSIKAQIRYTRTPPVDGLQAADLRLLKAALKAKRLTNLQINTSWTPPMIELLTQTPNQISMLSELTPRHETSLEDFLAPLKQLDHLRTLKLCNTASLNVGFYPPRCGNAYRHPGMRERVAKKQNEAEAKVVKIVEEIFGQQKSQLERLEIGGTVYLRAADGDRMWVKQPPPGAVEK